jgi:hypothetical protein
MSLSIFDDLLKLQVLKMTKTQPAAAITAAASLQARHKDELVRILQAPISVQNQLRISGAASTSPSRKQLAITLKMFAALSPAKKLAFIEAFKRRSAIVIGATKHKSLLSTWSSSRFPTSPN